MVVVIGFQRVDYPRIEVVVVCRATPLRQHGLIKRCLALLLVWTRRAGKAPWSPAAVKQFAAVSLPKLSFDW